MKVFILTTVMAPYRVQLFSEIGKQCELYVCFEQMRSSERNDNWYDETSTNFKLVRLKKWRSSVNTIKPEVLKHIRDIKPDVVIAYEYHTNTSLLLMSYCQIKRIPYIVNCDGAFISKSVKDVVKRFYISRASSFISSGKMADKYLLNYGADPKKIYRNHFTSLHIDDISESILTIEDKKILRQEKGIFEKRIVVSVGQFIYRKGYDVLLKAAASFSEDVGIYIIGGQTIPEYEKLVKDLDLKNVHFLDFMLPEELKKYYLAADLFVLPTREDVWGLVINEAMACALPVITTNRCVAGLEMIENEVNGFIVPVADHRQLHCAIDKVLSDEIMRNKMASENLLLIKKYTYEQSAIDIMRAIESCVQ